MASPIATSDPYGDRGDQSDGFIVRVYNKALEYQGILGGYESLTCVKRHNAISTAELVVRADHPRVAELLLAGARLVIDYNHELLMSGRMESRGASANAGTPVVTFNVVSDFQYLNLMLGWPNPDGDIDEQGAVTRHWTDAGLASNVAQAILQHAKARLGLNLVVFGDTNPYADMGSWITIQSRMDTLADVLVNKLDRAGVGISIGGYGTNGQLYVGFYEPTVRDEVLTVESGALVDWSWTQAEPTVTRVVIGGAGEGTEREYQTFTNTGREATMGTIKEAFVDARDIGSAYEDEIQNIKDLRVEKAGYEKESATADAALQSHYKDQYQWQIKANDATNLRGFASGGSPQWIEYDNQRTQALVEVATLTDETIPEFVARRAAADDKVSEAADRIEAAIVRRDNLKVWVDDAMAEKAQDVFYEFKTQYGLSLTLAETPGFRYGETFKVGDTVTVALPGSVTITDTVREVTISDTVEAGLIVSPVIGTQDTMDNPNRVLIGTIKRLMFAARKLNTSR